MNWACRLAYAFRAASRRSRPSSTNSSEAVNGVRMRIVFALTPHDNKIRPSSHARCTTRLVAFASGSSAAAFFDEVESDHGSGAADRGDRQA